MGRWESIESSSSSSSRTNTREDEDDDAWRTENDLEAMLFGKKHQDEMKRRGTPVGSGKEYNSAGQNAKENEVGRHQKDKYGMKGEDEKQPGRFKDISISSNERDEKNTEAEDAAAVELNEIPSMNEKANVKITKNSEPEAEAGENNENGGYLWKQPLETTTFGYDSFESGGATSGGKRSSYKTTVRYRTTVSSSGGIIVTPPPSTPTSREEQEELETSLQRGDNGNRLDSIYLPEAEEEEDASSTRGYNNANDAAYTLSSEGEDDYHLAERDTKYVNRIRQGTPTSTARTRTTPTRNYYDGSSSKERESLEASSTELIHVTYIPDKREVTTVAVATSTEDVRTGGVYFGGRSGGGGAFLPEPYTALVLLLLPFMYQYVLSSIITTTNQL